MRETNRAHAPSWSNFWLAAALCGVFSPLSAAEPRAREAEFFELKVRPLFAAHCYKCHGPKHQRGGLRLDSLAAQLQGGDSGPTLIPGQPDKSLLVKAIGYQDASIEMPPNGKLSDKEIAVLVQWVKIGAPWPGSTDDALPTRPVDFTISDADRQFWSFQPIGRPAPPPVRDAAWIQEPIDAFVLARLEAAGISPSPKASKRDLVRRVYFDVIGLPPSPEVVKDFITDDSLYAYERLVDRLLSTPHYGERWGRHWLDLVRYAQTNGYERDDEKPQAWRFRDYVVRAFNQDKTYDLFVKEQLAGDELEDVSYDSIIATGFYRLGVWDDEPDDKLLAGYDELDDIIRTTGETFLGVTIGCARCHDHKFDPIPQADYYRFLSFFHNIRLYGRPSEKPSQGVAIDGILTPLLSPKEFSTWRGQQERTQKSIETQQARIATLRAPIRERLFSERLTQLEQRFQQAYARPENERTDEEKKLAEEAIKKATPPVGDIDKALDKEAQAKKKKIDAAIKKLTDKLGEKPFAEALSVREPGSKRSTKTQVLIRGNPLSPGDEVKPRFLAVLKGVEPSPWSPPPESEWNAFRRTLHKYGVQQTTGLRRALAEWIVSDNHPLTARVLANRLWHYHFGSGLVTTPNDLGRNGRRPSHPQLLDWLARELVDSGWQLKRLHKRILLSATYRQASQVTNEAATEKDPDATLLWRQRVRRLEAEAIRDAVLTITGSLNRALEGPSIYPLLSKEVLATQSVPGKGWGTSAPQDRARRSLYIFVKRTLGVPFLELFDMPTPDKPDPARPTTTVAPQALVLLNSTFTEEQASALAARLERESPGQIGAQIGRVFELALGRSPEAEERALLIEYLRRQTEQFIALDSASEDGSPNISPRERALQAACKLVLNLNEFVYVD